MQHAPYDAASQHTASLHSLSLQLPWMTCHLAGSVPFCGFRHLATGVGSPMYLQPRQAPGWWLSSVWLTSCSLSLLHWLGIHSVHLVRCKRCSKGCAGAACMGTAARQMAKAQLYIEQHTPVRHSCIARCSSSSHSPVTARSYAGAPGLADSSLNEAFVAAAWPEHAVSPGRRAKAGCHAVPFDGEGPLGCAVRFWVAVDARAECVVSVPAAGKWAAAAHKHTSDAACMVTLWPSLQAQAGSCC